MPSPARIRRFERSTRLLHWLHGGLVLSLLLTGFLIYLPGLKASAIGGYRVVPLLHIVLGCGLILSPVLSLLLAGERRALLRDVVGAVTPEPRDALWVQWAGLVALGAKLRAPRVGKFNAGQKLNTVFWIAAYLWLGGTGLALAIFFFNRAWIDANLVRRLFPLHELAAWLVIVPLLGHLYLALVNRGTRPALSGILSGDVDAAWAAEHHADWYEAEIERPSPPAPLPPQRARGA